MPAANNVLQAFDWTLQGSSLNPGQANSNGLTINVGGLTGITLQVTGTFNATLNPEGTLDGSTWPSPGLFAINLSTGAVAATITAPGLYFVPTPGIDQFRARISAYVTGTVTVTAKGFQTASPFLLISAPTSANPIPGNLAQISGSTLSIGQQAMAASVPVVLASNQSAIPVTGAQDVTATINLAALNGAAQVSCQGTQAVGVLLSGTWTATLTPEVSADGGTTWAATQFYSANTQTFTATVAANGTYLIAGTGGMSHARVRASSYTSGTITGTLRASSQADDVVTAQISPVGQLARAASVPTVPAYDQYLVPSQLNANAATTALQPAGGAGPLARVPVADDASQQLLAAIADGIRELITVFGAALSP